MLWSLPVLRYYRRICPERLMKVTKDRTVKCTLFPGIRRPNTKEYGHALTAERWWRVLQPAGRSQDEGWQTAGKSAASHDIQSGTC